MDADRPSVWITGAGGLIGNYLSRLAPAAAPGHRIVPLTRGDLDLTDADAVSTRFARDRPRIILHCAAISRSPVCQENPALARRHNVDVTRRLVELGGAVQLVFFSTDLIFDGRTGGYTEESRPNPLMVYGETKLEAEALVLRNPANLVIRTSMNAGQSPTGDRGFDELLRTAWKDGRETPLFSDEIRTPIAAPETAQAVLDVVRAGGCGVYHISGGQRLSRWEAGMLIAARHPELNPRITRTSIHDQSILRRPADVSLDCSKAAALLQRPMPKFSEWVAKHG